MQNLFRESLEDLLFSKLYYLDNYVDQEAIHCLEGPKMYEFALSLPDIVLFTEHNYRQQQRCCRWSASKGNLHIALSNLIQLQDCFMWKGPGPGDLQFGVQFNATRRPGAIPVEVAWHPDYISFQLFLSFQLFSNPVLEGDPLRLVPAYRAISRDLSMLETVRRHTIQFSTPFN
ncbi:hypothetical protein DIZ76_013258 [Coccidioides immitis]|nr:hypothetical protein DIZ76_013258 [Coccidioides immitis]